jgi:hypothetical protein
MGSGRGDEDVDRDVAVEHGQTAAGLVGQAGVGAAGAAIPCATAASS